MQIALLISIISVTFSVIFGFFNLHFGHSNSKRTDTKEFEERVKENTRINMKLDNINSTTQDIKAEMSSLRSDVKSHNDRIIKVEESCKSAHHRIDTIEKRMDTERDG